MLYYFAALLTAALILFLSQPRSPVNRWAAIFLVFSSIGGLVDELRASGHSGWANAVEFMNLTITPYAVVVFCMVYSGLPVKRRLLAALKGILLLPIVATAAFTPFSPELELHYGWLLAWALPYYSGSCVLLIVSLLRERSPGKRKNRLITTAIFVPTLLSVLIFIYIAKAWYPEFEFFEYVSYFLIYSFVVGVLSVFVYGVLGFRLRIERDPLDDTMKAVTQGTRLLNHTLKNELGKIAVSADNLRRALPREDELSGQSLRIISDSADHMLEMVDRIHSRTKDIVLNMQVCRLDLIVDECVRRHRELLERGAIQVRTEYRIRPTLLCDPVHLAEAIGNLLTNAAEAMRDGGEIRVTLAAGKKGANAILSVMDTGTGIPKEALPRIYDPFFSTKGSSRNFGLGLSYVYQVMRKSGGTISVKSRVGEGTSVELHFPLGASKGEKG
ncbi:ATP-binding protein [Cohnella boryungensis]